MKKGLIGLLILVLQGACDPRFVDSSEQVDAFLAHNRLSAVCVALKNDRDDSLREYAAKKLAPNKDQQVATDCLCDAIYDAEFGTVDAAVARGIAGSNRGDLAQCLMPALDPSNDKMTTASGTPESNAPDRVLTVQLMAGIGGSEAYGAVAHLLKTSKSPDVRTAAVHGLQKERDSHEELLLDVLKSDIHAPARAAAAKVFERSKSEPVVAALLDRLANDEDGGVRAAALKSVVKLKLDTTDDMVCKAMMEDTDERVRDQAVRSFRGSKRSVAIQCLKRRLLTKEESAVVRASTLNALYRSPSDEAALVLCHSIGPFLRMYVKTGIADSLPAVNIIEQQNNRDFERSYECVQKAIRQGGYSCYARNHLGQWMNELGGKASTPWCPGMVKNGAGE